ncbi:MAG: hypothetical protein ACI4TX_04165 [Christensenellales bacterium]
MRDIFSKNKIIASKEKAEKEVNCNLSNGGNKVLEPEIVPFDKLIDDGNGKVEQTVESGMTERIEIYLPLYYDIVKLDGFNYGKAVKCYKRGDSDEIYFSNEIIDFESPNNIAGLLFADEGMTELIGKKYINEKLENLHKFLANCEDKGESGSEVYDKTKMFFKSLCEKFLIKETGKLSYDELKDFKMRMREVLSDDNICDILDGVKRLKGEYKQINSERKEKRLNLMPLFVVMKSDYTFVTVSVKCNENDDDEIEFKEEFVFSAGLNLDKIGNIYYDSDLQDALVCGEIQEKLTNLCFAYESLRDKDLSVTVDSNNYGVDKEIINAFYAISKAYLSKNNNFENEEDSQNAKMIIAEIKGLPIEKLRDDIYVIKEHIDYFYDEQSGIKYYRPRKKTRKSVKQDMIDLRSIDKEDIKIM